VIEFDELSKAIANPREARTFPVHLLTSQVVLEASLERIRNEDVGSSCALFSFLAAELTAFFGKDVASELDEAALIGWLNLFVELSNLKRDWLCEHCKDKDATNDPQFARLLHVLCLTRTTPADAIVNYFSLTQNEFTKWKEVVVAAQHAWKCMLTPELANRTVSSVSHGRPGNTNLGQTLAMHVLDRVLPWYEQSNVPRQRAELHVLLVPLLRMVFRNPARAHVAYQRYLLGSTHVGNTLFHRLYGRIAHTEILKSQTTADRDWYLEILSRASDDQKVRLLESILHGDPDHPQPNIKPTAICQLSMLVKEKDDGSTASVKYRTDFPSLAVMLPINGDEGPDWRRASDVGQVLKESLDAAYERGHQREHLARLFGGDSRGLVWVHDGEIAFAEFMLERADPRRFFDEDGKATARGWALVNFLERAAVHDKPSYYAPSVAARFTIDRWYKDLWNAAFTKDQLVVLTRPGKADLMLRLAVLEPEILLRNQEGLLPLSLFFYPIATSSTQGSLPGVLLAGTVGAIGAGELPDVAAACDYHLLAAIEAASPIIDAELARILHDRLEAVERAKQTALSKEVAPVVRELSRIFEGARGQLARIEAATDADWSGLFGEALGGAIGKIFDDGASLDFEKVPGFESCVAIRGAHDSKVTLSQFGRQLLYVTYKTLLGRRKGGWPNIATWQDDDVRFVRNWPNNAVGVKLQRQQAWMKQFLLYLEHLQEKREDIQNLNAAHAHRLLKMLTIRSLDSAKPLHPVQVIAALGLGARKVEVWGAQVEHRLFDLKSGDYATGVAPLVDVLEAIKQRYGSGHDGVQLAGGITASRFLRALQLLVTGPLGQGPGVVFERSVVDWDSHRILILIRCSGRFRSSVKNLIAAHRLKVGEESDDLRHNMHTVWEAACGHPVFTVAETDPWFGSDSLQDRRDAAWRYVDSLPSSFALLESPNGAEGKTVIVVRLASGS
jgi:hypothetical protein